MNAILLECCANTVKFVKCSCDLELATNYQDVAIAGTICSAIVRMTIIIVAGFLLWKLMDYLFTVCQECSKRKYDAESSNRKQIGEVLNKYFDFLKDLTYPYVENNKDRNHVKKMYDNDSCDKYKSELQHYLQKKGVLKP